MIRYSKYSLICEAYWLWSAKLDMTPLGVGQHFCLGLVKFMELVHHHHSLAEEGQTQTEKTVKMSVMLTRYVQAVVTSTDSPSRHSPVWVFTLLTSVDAWES